MWGLLCVFPKSVSLEVMGAGEVRECDFQDPVTQGRGRTSTVGVHRGPLKGNCTGEDGEGYGYRP